MFKVADTDACCEPLFLNNEPKESIVEFEFAVKDCQIVEYHGSKTGADEFDPYGGMISRIWTL